MKTIYFVRHGESEGNVGKIRQTTSTQLTEKGIEQVYTIAGRCAHIYADSIISSTMNRAKQTAEIISKTVQLPIEYSELFTERKRPSEVLGKPKDDPTAVKINSLIKENFTQSNWKYSDEENFEDLKKRALRSLHYLQEKSEENIIVVTHGYFLKILAACVLFGENLTSTECEKIITNLLPTHNAGITVFQYDKLDQENPWKISTWNDYSHLG